MVEYGNAVGSGIGGATHVVSNGVGGAANAIGGIVNGLDATFGSFGLPHGLVAPLFGVLLVAALVYLVFRR